LLETSWTVPLPHDSVLPLGEKVRMKVDFHCGINRCGERLQASFEGDVVKGVNKVTPDDKPDKPVTITIEGDRLDDVTVEIEEVVAVPTAVWKQYTLGNVNLKRGGRLLFNIGLNDDGELDPTQLRVAKFTADPLAIFIIQLPPAFMPVHDTALKLSLVDTDELNADRVEYILRVPLEWQDKFDFSFSTGIEVVDGRRFLQTVLSVRDLSKPKPTRAPAPTPAATTKKDNKGDGPNIALIAGAGGGGGAFCIIVIIIAACLVRRARRQARESPSVNAGGDTMMSARQEAEPYSTTPDNDMTAYDSHEGTARHSRALSSNYDVAPPVFQGAHPSSRTSYASPPAASTVGAMPLPPKVTDFQNSVYAVVPEALRTEEDPWEINFNELQMGKVLGEGAYGTVSEAMFRGKKVAVKQLHQNLLKPKDIKDFKKEAKLMKSLTPHANVVQLIGVNTDETNPPLFIVTEYCGGGACDSYLKKYGHLLNQSQRVAMMVAACRGVMHLHEQSIIHRDLACRNFLLTTEGGLKVADFGMSRDTTEDGNQTKCDVGPLRYMAPESMAKKTYSVETDCWAFGVVMWEIESNAATPYGDMALTMVAIGVAKEGLRLPQPKDCPDELYDLMMQCWSHNAADRPSFAEIDERLLALQP
jgi:tRNA A-37 threonylcarbamoyl transferase component Bud32